MPFRFFNTSISQSELLEQKLERDITKWLALPEALVERWRKPAKEKMKSVQVGKRAYRYEKVKECGRFGPSYILHGKNGARYGLFHGANEELLPVNLKTKKIVKTSRFLRGKNGEIQWKNAPKESCGKSHKKLKESVILNEGGAAAETLLPKLQAKTGNQNLKYTKIQQNQIGVVFKEIIEPMLKELTGAGLLDPNYKTEFGLGSTRLAAQIAGYKVKVMPSETPDILAKATQAKKSFGDVDVDVVLVDGKTIADVGKYLEGAHPEKFAFKLGNGEINVATVVDNVVIQIDIVDVTKTKRETEFMQSSSMVDLSHGIKGALQKWLIRAILSHKPLTPAHQKFVDQSFTKSPDMIKWTKQGYTTTDPNNPEKKVGRYQLSNDGNIYVVIDLYKPNVKTKKTIKVSEKPILNFDDVDKISDFILPGANEDVIISSLKVAEYMKKTMTKQQIAEIWSSFQHSVDSQKEGIGIDDYNKGMAKLAAILGQPFAQADVGA